MMNKTFSYPYPTYLPNKAAASSFAAIVSISLIAWTIQSCQIRFRPPRLTILLLISHLAILSELIVHAAVDVNTQYSKTVFSATSSLFAIGQRVIIVGNFILLMTIHQDKSWFARGVLITIPLCVITSGLLLAPANTLSLQSDHIQTSFLFRELSASILLAVTLAFYPVWYWSKTMKDMTMQAVVLLSISSVICVIVAIFILIRSTPNYYSKINSQEVWFYTFQMAPIIVAHFVWSILHPKRSLILPHQATLQRLDDTSIDLE